MAIADVGIAIAASRCGIIAAAIAGRVLDTRYFDNFTLHAEPAPSQVAILLASA